MPSATWSWTKAVRWYTAYASSHRALALRSASSYVSAADACFGNNCSYEPWVACSRRAIPSPAVSCDWRAVSARCKSGDSVDPSRARFWSMRASICAWFCRCRTWLLICSSARAADSRSCWKLAGSNTVICAAGCGGHHAKTPAMTGRQMLACGGVSIGRSCSLAGHDAEGREPFRHGRSSGKPGSGGTRCGSAVAPLPSAGGLASREGVRRGRILRPIDWGDGLRTRVATAALWSCRRAISSAAQPRPLASRNRRRSVPLPAAGIGR